MAASTYRTYTLAERPTGEIVPGKTFQAHEEPTPDASSLKEGEVLAETLYLSLDPAMRGWLNDTRSYAPPVQIGEVMRGWGILRVLASRSSKANVGDIVTGGCGWREIAVLADGNFQTPPPLPKGAQITDLLGALGMTGMTAFFGLDKIGHVQKGDTVVISGAAGATGSVAGQMAKNLGAGKVIGIAGSDDKLKWLTEELGFDVAINYKDPDFRQKLKDETPNFINVFWDNVGGDVLEAALSRAAQNSRFVECGMISQYNSTTPTGPRNLMTVIAQRIRMQGFLVFDYASEYPRAVKQLSEWIAEDKLKRGQSVIKGGLANVEGAWRELFSGSNTGKLLLEVKNPEDSPKL